MPAAFPGTFCINEEMKEQGSMRIAGLVAQGIRELGIMPLTMYVR